MLIYLLLRWAAMVLAFVFTDWVLGGLSINGGFWSYVWVALIFGLVNAVLGTLLKILTFPLLILTLGLFSLLINALMLSLTDWITDDLTIDAFFWTTIWAAILLSLANLAINMAIFRTRGAARAAHD